MSDSYWTKGLNPEQTDAVLHDFGPLLILAGAGSGKTTVLVSRTGRLIDEAKAKANEMLVLTFTNKAARELKHRVQKKVGARSEGLWSGTFHSFGLQLLKKNHQAAELPANFSIIDSSDAQSLLRDLMKNIKNSAKDKFDLDRLLNLINLKRTRQILKIRTQADEIVDEAYHEMSEALLPRYIRNMELLGVVDFEGLLIKPVELLQNNLEVRLKVQSQFSQIMVDEFQDTNVLQMKLVDLLSDSHQNLAVVGDDDQSIYGWRGAEVRNILDFPKKRENCKVIKLERNYRSTESILRLANKSIQNNKTRHGKVLITEKSSTSADNTLPELFIFDNETEEGDFVVQEVQRLRQEGYQLKDIAVLYRSNTQGALFEGDLRRARLDYQLSGSTSLFDRKEVKDVYSFLKQALHPSDVHLKRIINTPSRGLGEVALEKLNEYSKTHKCSFFQALGAWKEVGLPPKTGEEVDKLLGSFIQLKKDLLTSQPQQFVGETVGARLIHFLRHIGYRDHLISLGTEKGAFEKRWSLIEIFARIFDSSVQRNGATVGAMSDFLDSFLLRDREDEEDEPKDCLQLMTLHASKGLEFPVVILAGIEEDLLPHKNLGSNIDEERRLFYVGITRAQKKLMLTRCRTRVRHGASKPISPSRFLIELPKTDYVEFSRGVRPVSGQERQDLVQGFLKSLDFKSKAP